MTWPFAELLHSRRSSHVPSFGDCWHRQRSVGIRGFMAQSSWCCEHLLNLKSFNLVISGSWATHLCCCEQQAGGSWNFKACELRSATCWFCTALYALPMPPWNQDVQGSRSSSWTTNCRMYPRTTSLKLQAWHILALPPQSCQILALPDLAYLSSFRWTARKVLSPGEEASVTSWGNFVMASASPFVQLVEAFSDATQAADFSSFLDRRWKLVPNLVSRQEAPCRICSDCSQGWLATRADSWHCRFLRYEFSIVFNSFQ